MTAWLVSGHVFRRRGARGDVWYAKYRLPDGRRVKRRIGPAWSERGRPAEGYFTLRTSQAWLDEVLAQARRRPRSRSRAGRDETSRKSPT
jgi:hypothetical protein